MFALRLLGGLSLESETVPIGPGAQQRRRLSLLALLALGGERGMSRDRIQAFMWPESDAARARHALDQLLYSTRRDLGADSIVAASASDLRFNTAVVNPDLWQFDAAIRCERWIDAVELYAGPLLDGVHLELGAEFEQLLDAERMRREHDYHHALETLARAATANGDAAEALRWWRRRTLAEPTSLPVALHLMNALAAAGDRIGAVQHARVYQRLVRETLEIDPDPAVESLAQQILAERTRVGTPVGTQIARPDRRTTRAASPAQAHVAELSLDATARSPRFRWGARSLTTAVGVGLVVAALPLIRNGFSARPQSLPPRTAVQIGAAASPSQFVASSSALTASDSKLRTADPEARVLYLRGRVEWNRRTKAGLDSSVVLYRRAIDRDPTFAAAYTGLSEAYVMLGYFGFAPTDATFPKAQAAGIRALELDPRDGEAYAALGQVLAWEHRWDEAEQAYRRGLQLSPENPTVHQWYALLFAYLGRAHDAAVHTGEASRLDPLSVQINNMYGMMLYYDHDLSGALRQYERTVVDEPDSAWVRQNPWVLGNFARVAVAAGRYDLARRLIERALVVVPTHPRMLFDLATLYIRQGDTVAARAALARADTTNPQYLADRAWLYGLLGDLDRAYALLDEMKEVPLASLITLTNEPMLAAMRADPRYQELRTRLSMPTQ